MLIECQQLFNGRINGCYGAGDKSLAYNGNSIVQNVRQYSFHDRIGVPSLGEVVLQLAGQPLSDRCELTGVELDTHG
jgi:hypothetical protein